MKTYKQVEAIDHICEQQYQDEVISEAEYQGKTRLTLVILIWKLKEMILQDVKLSEPVIIVQIKKIKLKQDIGHVINGELEKR
jgi:hypothetical protein